MELAGTSDDDLQSVVGRVGGEGGRGCPGEGAGVGEVIAQAVDWDHILGGTAEEDERDGAGGCRLVEGRID